MDTQRKTGLDIIRAFAICIVMVTHMYNYTGVLDFEIRSVSWTGYAFIKFASIIGVPLFLLLTGYLQSSRKANAKHFSSIIPVLLSYFVISAVNAVGESFLLNTEFEIIPLAVSIFDYEYGYAWYVEMYIGLFLIIPFLNILYTTLEKKHKHLLIGILSFVSFVPAAFQFFMLGEYGFEILPDFFINLYVIAYYFIGAYIAEYKPSPKKITCVAVGGITLIFETVLCYCFSESGYAWWLFNNVASVTHAIVAVCVFLFFCNVQIKNRFAAAVFKYVSICSFEMYLLSYLTDRLCYTYLPHLPVWALLIANFSMALAGSAILRSFIVPSGRFLKNKILKNT